MLEENFRIKSHRREYIASCNKTKSNDEITSTVSIYRRTLERYSIVSFDIRYRKPLISEKL